LSARKKITVCLYVYVVPITSTLILSHVRDEHWTGFGLNWIWTVNGSGL